MEYERSVRLQLEALAPNTALFGFSQDFMQIHIVIGSIGMATGYAADCDMLSQQKAHSSTITRHS